MTDRQTKLATLAQHVLEAAQKAGADHADTVINQGESRSIEVRDGALEQAESADALDLGLRVLVGQRQAIVSVSDSSATAIAEMAERAVVMAKLAPDDEYLGLADPSDLSDIRDASALELADPAKQPNAAELEDMALRAEAASRAVKGVTKTDVAGAGSYRGEIHLAATNGFAGGYARTSISAHSVAIAGDGLEMERDYAGESRVFTADLPDVAEIGQLAGERAVERMGARKPPTGSFPVLYDERIATSLIGHLLSAVNGISITRGSSWLRDAMGEQVLPKGLSITEEASPHASAISSPMACCSAGPLTLAPHASLTSEAPPAPRAACLRPHRRRSPASRSPKATKAAMTYSRTWAPAF